ncbi:heavy metal translocating P-type ATPase [Entomospira entomophila]|uniref:Copper-translocating P-type ATPase n=1 Tax=Entomospira entomophila TaxID=2719988 RepID=A0A968KTY2_9SPIO|nr:heavy metal translocating P-type ATPase [Entomospira entomophilus]NIZ40846.1 copper-translocating P-type ATPase [Entomospira entomophilus]WDI35058.1 heavy metal translocating P-type ATPase [Entomospira entomophilus]
MQNSINQSVINHSDSEITQSTLAIQNMTCAACSSAIERKAKKIAGVEHISVNLVTGKASIRYNPVITPIEAIIQSINQLGYPTRIAEDHLANTEKEFQQQWRELWWSLIFGGTLFSIAMISMFIPIPFYSQWSVWHQALIQILLLIPIIIASKSVYRKGITGIFQRSANMDTLIALSTITAIIYSFWLLIFPTHGHHAGDPHFYFETVAVILTLVKLGKYLEIKSKKRANTALADLFHLESDTALLVDEDHQISSVDANSVTVGSKILLRAGMRIPFDGIIIEGEIAVDESHLTGESMPVSKALMDRVHAGSLNQAGSAIIQVDRTGENTTLAQLRRMIEDAQLTKAPIARLADRISGIFVPIVFIIATLSSISWYLATQDLTFALTIFMSVLVIACPCALGLATPTAIVVGVNRAATLGILIKNGETLEKISSTQVVIFDKTGTLTTGEITVSDVVLLHNDIERKFFLQLTASAEERSEHPIARSIVKYVKKENISLLPTTTFTSEVGFGIEASIESHIVVIGIGLLEKLHLLTQEHRTLFETISSNGLSPIPVAINNQLVGYFLVRDTLKESSSTVISALHQRNIQTILLSGDQYPPTQRVAEELSIDSFYAEATPQKKEEIVHTLSQTQRTMMVGDGINDAAALSGSDVALTIHNASDITIEVSDVVLMKNDMNLILKAIDLSHKTLQVIKQNLFWAFIYNIIGIPIAAGLLHIFGGPLLNPMLGALFMAFSSIFVLINSLRLKSIAIS